MTEEQCELAILQEAMERLDGIWMDFTPPAQLPSEMAAKGLLEVIILPGFHGGIFRITERGREEVKRRAPPEGEW
jgi:hypothetical protein